MKPLALTIARIVRVNHAGEFGAIRIYSAQITVATRLYPDIVPALSEMVAHEREHCSKFLAAMPARKSLPCRTMSLWSWGGWLLGFLTALLGRQAIWVCTSAVEEAVHRHLDEQLEFLHARDAGLRDIILSIREEELAHLHHAEAQITVSRRVDRFLRGLITVATETVIWFSTWGDSARMARDLHRHRSTNIDAAPAVPRGLADRA